MPVRYVGIGEEITQEELEARQAWYAQQGTTPWLQPTITPTVTPTVMRPTGWGDGVIPIGAKNGFPPGGIPVSTVNGYSTPELVNGYRIPTVEPTVHETFGLPEIIGGAATILPYIIPTANGQAGPPAGFGGPGVAEPPASMVKNRWETRVYDNKLGYIKLNFYALTNGQIAMYHNYKKYWKLWRPKKNVVISSNPRLKDLKKLDRLYAKMQKMVRKFAPKPRTTSRQAPSAYLSQAERKLLGN